MKQEQEFDFKKNIEVVWEKISKSEETRYFSWEHCYSFFYKNKSKILTNSELLEKAQYMLAFYLASWGMYRGSAFLLNYDYKIHENVIKDLLNNCSNLWKNWDEIEWSDIKTSVKFIKNGYSNNKPTNTLITKILMGIFGCIPAYDRYVVNGIGKYNTSLNKNIVKTFGSNSFNNIKDFLKSQRGDKSIFNKNLIEYPEIKYPPMRFVDMYFWHIGYNSEKI